MIKQIMRDKKVNYWLRISYGVVYVVGSLVFLFNAFPTFSETVLQEAKMLTSAARIETVKAQTLIDNLKEVEQEKSLQEKVWDMLTEYGLTFNERVEAMSIIKCESNFNPYAIGVNKNGSKDLGLWQTNENYQTITRECAFSWTCQTKYVMENIYLKQKNWSAWTCSR